MANNVKEGDLARIVNPPAAFAHLAGRIVRVLDQCAPLTLADLMLIGRKNGGPQVWWHVDPDDAHTIPDCNLRRIENPSDDEVSQEKRAPRLDEVSA